MDEADRAEIREQIMRDEALACRKPELQAVGYCHYCSESVAAGKQFCDGGDCRDGWEMEQAARRRNGAYGAY